MHLFTASSVMSLFFSLGWEDKSLRERKRLLLFLGSQGGGGCEGVGLSAPCWEHGGAELGGVEFTWITQGDPV